MLNIVEPIENIQDANEITTDTDLTKEPEVESVVLAMKMKVATDGIMMQTGANDAIMIQTGTNGEMIIREVGVERKAQKETPEKLQTITKRSSPLRT